MLSAVHTPEKIGPVPDQPKTRGRSIRIDDPEWVDAGAAVELAGTDRSKLVNQFLNWWLHRPGAKLPERLTQEQIDAIVRARLESEAEKTNGGES